MCLFMIYRSITYFYLMESILNVTIEYIAKLFKNNMNIRKKIIYDFHLKIVHDHITELLATKETTCKSGFIREIIYRVINSLSLKFKLEIVGYKLKRSLCRWIRCNRSQVFYTPGMMINYINKGMVIEKEICQSQINAEIEHTKSCYSYKYTDRYEDLSTIKSLFDKNTLYETKCKIIENILDDKWNIFESCNLYKPIKKIVLV